VHLEGTPTFHPSNFHQLPGALCRLSEKSVSGTVDRLRSLQPKAYQQEMLSDQAWLCTC